MMLVNATENSALLYFVKNSLEAALGFNNCMLRGYYAYSTETINLQIFWCVETVVRWILLLIIS